ncbi:transposase [Streptomyces chartreusis]|uniref:transposase n=1 Tax=Streptomyces chartreusis TaxID=1969 RepID=UPI00380F1A79
MSVAVAAQYCGALGKPANCQVPVSVHAATDTASCALQWRLFRPRSGRRAPARRAITRVLREVTHREKWWLALDMLDAPASWDMRPPVVVADAAYGPAPPANGVVRAWAGLRPSHLPGCERPPLFGAEPVAPARNGPIGCWPQPRYRQAAPSIAAWAISLGQQVFSSPT